MHTSFECLSAFCVKCRINMLKVTRHLFKNSDISNLRIFKGLLKRKV